MSTNAPCCHEYNCRRKKPILVRLTGLTNRWVVVTRYTKGPNDSVTASEKHDIDADFTEYLSRQGYVKPEEAERLREVAIAARGVMTPTELSTRGDTAREGNYARLAAALGALDDLLPQELPE